MFTVGTSFNFHACKLLGFRCFFDIGIVFVMKLLQQTMLLGQPLLALKYAQLEVKIFDALNLFKSFLFLIIVLSSTQTRMLLMW